MTSKPYPLDSRHRHVLLNRNCLSIVCQRKDGPPYDGFMIFSDFLQQNSMCFWNSCLSRSVSSLEYRGYLVPCTLLISGTDFALEVIRSAWARRVLRPPKGYVIIKLGDTSVLEMVSVPQTQFAPLSEAVCKVVADLYSEWGVGATTSSIRMKLEENFPEMQVPTEDILLKSLISLVREGKLCRKGNGYMVAGPETYKTVPASERQMLMTNEEAILKLHGKECSMAIQVDEMDIVASTSAMVQASSRSRDISCQINQPPSDVQVLERSHSLKMTRMRPKGSNEQYASFKESTATKRLSYLANGDMDFQKGEKVSMLSRILKRMHALKEKGGKPVPFSAQFPPLEWLEENSVLCHSVATQTLHTVQKPCVSHLDNNEQKIPWKDTDDIRDKEFMHFFTPHGLPKTLPNMNSGRKPGNVLLRQNHSRYSPSHRYSYGTLNNSKRRSRHKRSSSESPKIAKNTSNESKCTEDHSDGKFTPSSSSVSTNNPKIPTIPRIRGLDLPQKFKPKVASKSPLSERHSNIPQNNAQLKIAQDSKPPSKSTPSPGLSKKVLSRDSETDPLAVLSDAKLALSETSSDLSISYNDVDSPKKDLIVQPPKLKKFVEMPPKKLDDIVIDNSVSVEVTSPKANNISTTVVTEETTVTKGKNNSKVVTVTSITTSLSQGKPKDEFNPKVTENDLNFNVGKPPKIIDCSSSCNIITEMK